MEDLHVVGVESGLEFIRQRLEEGWVLVIGEEDCIKEMKKQVAPPYSSYNRDMIFITIGNKKRVVRVYLARKTERLKKFLYRDAEQTDLFSKTLMVEAVRRWESCVYYSVSREDIPSDVKGGSVDEEEAIEKILDMVRRWVEDE
jgi:hypothetical protein